MNARDAEMALAQVGYYGGPIQGDVTSPEFRAALRRFQRDNGLKRDGVYGPKSDKKLSAKHGQVMAAMAGEPLFQHMQPWTLTGYWLAQARPGSVPVPAQDGKTLAMVTSASFVAAALEGTTILEPAWFERFLRLFRAPKGADIILNVAQDPGSVPVVGGNYAGVLSIAKKNGWLPDKAGYAGIRVADGKVTHARAFKEVPVGPKGWPYWNKIEADPFRTLAADLGRFGNSDKHYRGKGGLVPVGTRVFVLELAGRKLPDGSVHDGWCTVNDTGGGIFGAHFDVFCGLKADYLRKPVPSRGLIWYAGVEEKTGYGYSYGLS